MISICRYTQDKQKEWDAFVKESKNGTFLFLRAYMDYHNDRFTDHSLMYFNERGKLIAIMPANEKGKAYHSHQGLTYGGFILLPKTHLHEVGMLFSETTNYLKENGFEEWYYRQMPSVYHKIPAQEDEYWLWRHNAEKVACNMMTAIDLRSDISIISSRKLTYFNKLSRSGYSLNMEADIEVFWPILEQNLMERFNSLPVHTLSEIKMLQDRFPDNIVCCTVTDNESTPLAGTLLFISDQVVRTQYISASHEGKKTNALDYLMLSLTKHFSKLHQYNVLEFGTSMDEDGINLNEGLVLQKEGFGGRSIACNTLRIQI